MVESNTVSRQMIVSRVMNEVVRMGGKTRIHLLRAVVVAADDDVADEGEVEVEAEADEDEVFLIVDVSLSLGFSDVNMTLFIK